LNFFLVSLLSLSPLVAATLVVVGRLVGLVVDGLNVDFTSTVLGRFKSRSKEFSDSLGRLGACESVTASGTAGTGMNWRYGSITRSPSSLTSFGTLASGWVGLITGAPGTAATAIKDGGSTQPEGRSPP